MTSFASRGWRALLLLASVSWGQAPIALGSASYASFPPPEAGTAVDSFQRLSRLDVMPGETRAIPTNDWWTHVLVEPFAGELWAHPLVADPDAQGVRLWYPTAPAPDGNGMQRGNPVRVSGAGFAPVRDLARDWGDWHVVVRLEDGAKTLDMTLVRGMPLAWFEVAGFQPRLELSAGVRPFLASGAELGATAVATDRLVLADGTKSIGVHLPAGTQARLAAGAVELTLPAGSGWFALSGLPARQDLDAWQAWATVVPRSTQVSWSRGAPGRIEASYRVTGQDLSGSGRSQVLQTFPPHAWRDALSAPTWRSESWLCPRGRLKSALGNTFTFAYDMPGILPDYGAAEADAPNEATPWRKSTQDSLVSAYLARATYGADTYWGGKDLVLLAKHAVFARRTGHPDAGALLAKAREALKDWLTWTPGEKAHYFAWYPRWKALVGFQESYGSSQFTDNHFHYGYLVHAAALVGSLDPAFLADYGPMLRKIAKQYANWDRADASLPFLRTFDPWTGHSYAGGTSAAGGNNQESTSEAMQSWIGMFLLGAALGDTAMRDAASFGYLMESRATLEYWFDWKRENFAPGWKHSMVGILFDGGLTYGTWFSGNPLHIHAIQYLPICPGFSYLARDTAWARGEYEAMASEVLAAEKWADESQYGDDWANVAFGFKQLFDPAMVCRRFQADRGAKGWTAEINAGVTYAYAHANRQLGAIDWSLSYSLPTAMGFSKEGRTTHVIWNPADQEAECVVYRGGLRIGSIRVPAHSVVRSRMDAAPARIAIVAPGRTLPSDAPTALALRAWDQYGASIEPGVATWTTTSGHIDAQGVFTPAGAADSVRITARASGLEAALVVRVGAAPRLSGLEIAPPYVQILTGTTRPLKVRGLDQYGDAFAIGPVAWEARGGVTVAQGTLTAARPGTAWVVVSSAGIVDSIPVDVYDRLLDLSSEGRATASSSLGANTPGLVLDGSRATRWESAHGIDTVWLSVELDTIRQLVDVVIDWEAAAAARYEVQMSDDGIAWRTWTRVTGGVGGLDSLQGTGHGRFVRMLATARTTAYGYSIWELRLRGYPRTAYSARLEGDASGWTDPPSESFGRARDLVVRSLRLGSHSFPISLRPGEEILSAGLYDLRGRRLDAGSAAGIAVLQLRTSMGWRAMRVVLE